MAGLNLIQEYLSETDEETENSCKENEKFISNKNTNTKLPLPESILSWKGVLHHEEVVDNPLEHDGRVRSFKHERGNWATLVYLNYVPSKDLLQWLKSALEQVVPSGNLFEEFHVSLTRTLILKFHWIDSFVEAVKNISICYPNFIMELNNIKIYCNDDKSRTFIGITVQSVNSSLQNLTQALDKLLNEYQLPPFYEDASYHISIFWCLGDQRKTLEALLPCLKSSFSTFLNKHLDQQQTHVNAVKCKIGNKLYSFNLR